MHSDPNHGPRGKSTTRLDLFLICLILFFSIVSILWMSGVSSDYSTAPDSAEIYRGKQLIETVDLTEDRHIQLQKDGMQIEVKAGRIRVLQSDCPKQTCVNMSWMQHSGHNIVCVPNKVRIEIQSERAPMIDAVVS